MIIVQRLIFYVYTLLCTLLLLAVVLVCARFLPLEFLWTSVAVMEGNWKIGLGGLIFFLVGVWVLLAGLFKKKRKKAATYYNLTENVNISLEAIENFIEKVARGVDGVRDTKVEVFLDAQTGTNITAVVKTAVSQEINISDISAEMRTLIKECVQNTTGVHLSEIKIVVETISSDLKIKNRVQ